MRKCSTLQFDTRSSLIEATRNEPKPLAYACGKVGKVSEQRRRDLPIGRQWFFRQMQAAAAGDKPAPAGLGGGTGGETGGGLAGGGLDGCLQRRYGAH